MGPKTTETFTQFVAKNLNLLAAQLDVTASSVQARGGQVRSAEAGYIAQSIRDAAQLLRERVDGAADHALLLDNTSKVPR